ncbi:MAG: hypothetical protein QNI84_06800 [Henriciella sp.]|nr:hypothetical protein [Henriciella sp.]
MAAQRKSESVTQLVRRLEARPTDDETQRVSAVDDPEAVAPIASPARHLQKQLRGHFNPMVREFSARFVTLALTLACLGTWVAGFGLHSTL